MPTFLREVEVYLIRIIQPFCPSEETHLWAHQNAKDWTSATIQTLKEHYLRVQEEAVNMIRPLLVIDWNRAFLVAARRARQHTPHIREEALEATQITLTSIMAPSFPLKTEKHTGLRSETMMQREKPHPEIGNTSWSGTLPTTKVLTSEDDTPGTSPHTDQPLEAEEVPTTTALTTTPQKHHRHPDETKYRRLIPKGMNSIAILGTPRLRPFTRREPHTGEQIDLGDKRDREEEKKEQNTDDPNPRPAKTGFTKGPPYLPLHTEHPHRGETNLSWSLLPQRQVLLIGDSNLARFPEIWDPRIQVDSFPGAKISHAPNPKTTPNPNLHLPPNPNPNPYPNTPLYPNPNLLPNPNPNTPPYPNPNLLPNPNPNTPSYPNPNLLPNPNPNTPPYPNPNLLPNPNPNTPSYPNPNLLPNPNPNTPPYPNPNLLPNPNPNLNPKPNLLPNPTPNPNPNPHLLPNPNPNPNPNPTPSPNPNPNPPPTPNPNPNPNTPTNIEDNSGGVPDPQTSAFPQKSQIIPFISTFSHRTTTLQYTIKQNFSTILHQHPAFHNHKIILAHRKNRNLHSILTTSKFPDQFIAPRPRHSQHYRNRKFIQNTYTGTGFPTLGLTSIHSTNAVYIITCTLCNKHYIGETQNSIHTRLTQHLYNIAGSRLGTTLVRHFQEHPVSHLIISGLETNNCWTVGQRRRAERIWINKLGTKTPHGLNEHP
ncbi:hypothetical protein D4764_07G0011820 [Takifugu flavidus]|uniref:GIY-YIG domain-containing protein n=1 Tax=Takifugu flavidus TaxID=433684 RepID=A0A5C6MU16_9TELE|nr:hypothetical protein D4764_07G0011820 [Takifugu flavidus]